MAVARFWGFSWSLPFCSLIIIIMFDDISLYDLSVLSDAIDDENETINIQGLTLIDTSNTYENSLTQWSDSFHISSYQPPHFDDIFNNTSYETANTTIATTTTHEIREEKFPSITMESWPSLADDADNLLYLSNRLSPHEEACSVDENRSIPTTPTKDIDDQWIYPPTSNEYDKIASRLSPESSSNEAFLLKIQAQAPPNRILFSTSTANNTPIKPISIFPSPSLSPFTSCIFSTSTCGIAFPQHIQSHHHSALNFSPLTHSSNQSFLNSSLDISTLSPFADLDQLLNEPNSLKNRNTPESLVPLCIECFPSISWLKPYGVTIFQRSADLSFSCLEYALFLPASLLSILFDDNFSLQDLSVLTNCQMSFQDILHEDSIQQFLIISSFFPQFSHNELLSSCHHALQEISSHLLSRVHPTPTSPSQVLTNERSLEYSHLLESTELLLAGTPLKSPTVDSGS